MDARNLAISDFEEHRDRLHAIAYRMLGSASEAEDAVQEAWLRASSADVSVVSNLAAWLTTVTSRVCLNLLRSRTARREDPLDVAVAAEPRSTSDTEAEAVLASSVGPALLLVLDRLAPAERVAFVLHDAFAVPFEQIADVLDRSVESARQLASRARRRVRGPEPDESIRNVDDVARERRVVEAYLAAARRGSFEDLLALLAPDVTLHVDRILVPAGASTEVVGAEAVASGARRYRERAQFAEVVALDGHAAVAIVQGGRLLTVQRFTVVDGMVVAMDIVGDPDRLAALDLTVP